MEKSYQILLMVGCVIVLLLGTLIFLGSASTRVERVSAHPLELSSDQIAAVPLNATAGDVPTYYVYLPLALNAYPEPAACNPIPGETYTAISVVLEDSQPPSPSAEEDAGFNINLLDFQPRPEYRYWSNVGEMDPTAPQFAYVYADARQPAILEAYQLYCNGAPAISPDEPVDVSALGLPASPGQEIHVPERFGSHVQIDVQGYKALVLYASESSITLKYGREDGLAGDYDEYGNPTKGAYVAFIDGICVEPSLLALYEQKDAEGRTDLPAVFGHQAIGRAWGEEIRVAIRDTGTLLDPRWQNDWWIYP